jgi:hypothetical protein
VKIEEVPWKTTTKITEQSIRVRSPKVIAYTHTTWDGTWVRYFNWFWFHPRTYTIKAWKDNTNEYAVWSDWAVDEKWVSAAMYVRPDGNRKSILNDTSTSFLLRDESNDITWGTHYSYGSDGIYIDVESAAFNAKIVITAYE